MQFPKCTFRVKIGLLRSCRLEFGPSAATKTLEDLGGCRLENYTFGKLPYKTYKTDLAELLESFSVLAASCLSLARSVKASVLKGSEIIPSCSTRTWSRKSLEAGRSVNVSWVEELEMFLTSFKV